MKQKTKYKVALDIGTHFVKMLAASDISNKAALAAFGIKKIAGLSREEVSRSIKSLMEESNIAAREVNISVAGPSVTVRFISMPKMKEEDIRSSIKFEAEKFIPFDVNDCVLDFQILKKDDREHKIDIILVAAKKGYVTERVKLVEDAGFSVDVIDVDSFALANAFLRNFSESTGLNKNIALLNIGATTTNLSIINLGAICFARDILIGCGDIDLASPNSVYPILSNLMDDVKMSFSYHENQCGRSVEEIYLSGGCSEVSFIDALCQDNLGMTSRHWNALQFLDTASSGIDMSVLDKVKNSFAVTAGLLLR